VLTANPATLARQVVLLLHGSFAVVLLNRDPSYMTAGEAAFQLIRAAAKRTEKLPTRLERGLPAPVFDTFQPHSRH
jgi:hypothetical protein